MIYVIIFVICIGSLVSGAVAAAVFPLTDQIENDTDHLLQLVNKDYLFDDATREKDLVELTVRTANNAPMRLRRAASRAISALFSAAESDGVRLYVISAFRDYATQKALYYNNLQDVGFDDHSTQIPGASEHQTGLAADVISREFLGYTLTEDFGQTVEAKWLKAHCAEYGFIIRYPKEKEAITGIIYEPWHIRYVGVDAARYMTDNNLTLEELWLSYYLYLEENAF